MSSLFDSLNFPGSSQTTTSGPSSSQGRSSQPPKNKTTGSRSEGRASRQQQQQREARVFWQAPPPPTPPPPRRGSAAGAASSGRTAIDGDTTTTLGATGRTAAAFNGEDHNAVAVAGPSRPAHASAYPQGGRGRNVSTSSTATDASISTSASASTSGSTLTSGPSSHATLLRQRRSKLTRPPPRRLTRAANNGTGSVRGGGTQSLRRHMSSSAAFGCGDEQARSYIHHQDSTGWAAAPGPGLVAGGNDSEAAASRMLADLNLQIELQRLDQDEDEEEDRDGIGDDDDDNSIDGDGGLYVGTSMNLERDDGRDDEMLLSPPVASTGASSSSSNSSKTPQRQQQLRSSNSGSSNSHTHAITAALASTPRPSNTRRVFSSWERTATFPPTGSPANGTTLVVSDASESATAEAPGANNVDLSTVSVEEFDWRKDLQHVDMGAFMDEDDDDDESFALDRQDGKSDAGRLNASGEDENGANRSQEGAARHADALAGDDNDTGDSKLEEQQQQQQPPGRGHDIHQPSSTPQEQRRPAYHLAADEYEEDSFDADCFDDATLSQMPLPAVLPLPAASKVQTTKPAISSSVSGSKSRPQTAQGSAAVQAPAARRSSLEEVLPPRVPMTAKPPPPPPPPPAASRPFETGPLKKLGFSSPFSRSKSHGEEAFGGSTRRGGKRGRDGVTPGAGGAAGNGDDGADDEVRLTRRARTTSTSPTKRAAHAPSIIPAPAVADGAPAPAPAAGSSRTTSLPITRKRLGSAVALNRRSASGSSAVPGRAPSPTTMFKKTPTSAPLSQSQRGTCRPAGLVRTTRSGSGSGSGSGSAAAGAQLRGKMTVPQSTKTTAGRASAGAGAGAGAGGDLGDDDEDVDAALRDFLADDGDISM